MFAYEIPGMRFSLPAGAEVKRHRFVSINTSSNGITATADTSVVGVSMNEVKADQVLEVSDGIVMVEAAGAVTAGVPVYSDATGRAAVTGTTVVGIAMTAATAEGELITVKV